jgi:2-oxo-3-hexenedioate decarboxylase
MDYIKSLVDARTQARTVARPSEVDNGFDLDAGYGVAAGIDAALRDRGWRHAGRKLGFTNKATWSEFDLATPIWSYVYDRTVIDAETGSAEVSLSDLVAPRIEPEIVLGLNDGIVGAGVAPAALVDAVEWVAPGFEVVDCHFAGWRFNAADIVADFGAHARLVVGPKVTIGRDMRSALVSTLAEITVDLRCRSVLVDSGIGANALGGPLAALAYLVDTLERQPGAERLAGGELVTTGTLTGIPFVNSGQRWKAAFAGAGLGELEVRLL